MRATIIIDDVRYHCSSAVTKALIRWLLDNYADLSGSGQFVIDYGSDGFVPHRKQDFPRVRVAA